MKVGTKLYYYVKQDDHKKYLLRPYLVFLEIRFGNKY